MFQHRTVCCLVIKWLENLSSSQIFICSLASASALNRFGDGNFEFEAVWQLKYANFRSWEASLKNFYLSFSLSLNLSFTRTHTHTYTFISTTRPLSHNKKHLQLGDMARSRCRVLEWNTTRAIDVTWNNAWKIWTIRSICQGVVKRASQ